MYAQIFWIGANVMDANISWTQIFHGCEYFMGANISWVRIFHGREYFMGANILIRSKYFCVNYYLRQAPLFDDFAVSSAQFLQYVLSVFAIRFCFDFCCKYLYIFSESIYACCMCQYFWRKCFEI
jgi:hypothetical protein